MNDRKNPWNTQARSGVPVPKVKRMSPVRAAAFPISRITTVFPARVGL
jgi:hypothetical protein